MSDLAPDNLLRSFDRQSFEANMIIKKFDIEHVGIYICKGNNSLGGDWKSVTIGMKEAPVFNVFPTNLKLREDEKASVRCSVEKVEGNYTIRWKLGSKYVMSKVSDNLCDVSVRFWSNFFR